MVLKYVHMKNSNLSARNVVVLKYVHMAEEKQNAQIVMVLKYVNQEKNHIIVVVGRWAIGNIMGFAHVGLLIYFQIILKLKA